MRTSAKQRSDPKAIGRRIKELRAAERQDDFAPLLGITQGHLSKIERGMQAPTVEVLLRLRERYGKSLDWILTGKEWRD